MGHPTDWWTAVGTLAAASFAFLAFLLAAAAFRSDRLRIGKLEQRESDRDARDADRALREQRSQAGAVYFSSVEFAPAADPASGAAFPPRYMATLSNSSDKPIDVQVVSFIEVLKEFDSATGSFKSGDVPLTADPRHQRLAPGASQVFTALATVPEWARWEAVAHFRDANGQRWRLNSYGHLSEAGD